MKELKALPKSVATLFFFIGITSAFSFRAIIIVQHVQPSLVRLLWYVAVISNLIFFMYRYYISLKRRRAIQHQGLIDKLRQNELLEAEERNVMIYLLTSIERSRENLNYLSIFVLSAIAIIIDLIMTFR